MEVEVRERCVVGVNRKGRAGKNLNSSLPLGQVHVAVTFSLP